MREFSHSVMQLDPEKSFKDVIKFQLRFSEKF